MGAGINIFQGSCPVIVAAHDPGTLSHAAVDTPERAFHFLFASKKLEFNV